MIRVGITGNIGSGKSTVCSIFESLKIPIYYADREAKNLYTKYPEIKLKVINLLGNSAYLHNGLPNIEFIRSEVFNNPQKLESLNNILHPFVFYDFDLWCKNIQETQPDLPYIIKEAAILFESGADKTVQKTILVSAPTHLKIQRAQQRDNTSEEEVRKRLSKQFSEEDLQKRVNFIIINDEIKPLIPQVLAIHHQLVQLNQSH
jgi:dephospho-CoA kinase